MAGCGKTLRVENLQIIKRFCIAFMANGKRQAEIFSLMKNNEAFLV